MGMAQEAKLLQSELPPTNEPVVVPLFGVMLPVQEFAFSDLNVIVDEPLLVVTGVAATGVAGPNVTFPDPPLPHPAPLELVAVACKWPDTEPFETAPVKYEQTWPPGTVMSRVVWAKATGDIRINAIGSRRRIVIIS